MEVTHEVERGHSVTEEAVEVEVATEAVEVATEVAEVATGVESDHAGIDWNMLLTLN